MARFLAGCFAKGRIMREETIAAIATPPGEGGIGIVRISGDRAKEILDKIFDGKDRLAVNRLTYGHITDNFTGKLIDEVMAVYMKAPHSYTAEDVAEIQCHGGMMSLREILNLTYKNGAVPAEPGEFTKRAFLNGRLDLSQAEAVIDLIRAKSPKSFNVALDQLEGKFSLKIKELRGELVENLVNLAVNIDYPDEDIEVMTYEKLIEGLSHVREGISQMLKTAHTGRILQEGLKVSIIGKPNVGKSSLMNALLKDTRAIVTEIPGTTRDTIEEAMTIRGIPVRLIDTAGIRETEDIIEKIGIERSKEAFNKADIVIFMVDNNRALDGEDFEILEKVEDRTVIAIINKTDLESRLDRQALEKAMGGGVILEMSLSEDKGVELLEEEVEKLVYGGKVRSDDSLMVTNLRHERLLIEAEHALEDALEMAKASEPLELVEIDVNRAYELLGSIIGETVEENIIDEIFARFCLGK